MRNKPLPGMVKRSPLNKKPSSKLGLKFKPTEPSKLNISKRVGLYGGKGTSETLSEVLPTGAYGDVGATYRPTKTLTLRGGASGSVSKHGESSFGTRFSLKKKFKKGGFNIGVSKQKGSKPFYGGGITFNI